MVAGKLAKDGKNLTIAPALQEGLVAQRGCRIFKKNSVGVGKKLSRILSICRRIVEPASGLNTRCSQKKFCSLRCRSTQSASWLILPEAPTRAATPDTTNLLVLVVLYYFWYADVSSKGSVHAITPGGMSRVDVMYSLSIGINILVSFVDVKRRLKLYRGLFWRVKQIALSVWQEGDWFFQQAVGLQLLECIKLIVSMSPALEGTTICSIPVWRP